MTFSTPVRIAGEGMLRIPESRKKPLAAAFFLDPAGEAGQGERLGQPFSQPRVLPLVK